MSTIRWAIVAALVAACGGAQDLRPHPDLSRFDDERLASKQLCETAVTNTESNYQMSTTRRRPLYDRFTWEREHVDRVRKCTITLSERQAACLAYAPSVQYARNCERFPELQ